MAETKMRRLTLIVGLGAALVVAVLVVLVGPKRLSRWLELSREPLPVSAAADRIDIQAGDIELADFARFFQDFTGLSVVIDSKITKRTVTIPAPMRDINVETVRAFIEENGYDVFTDELPDATKVIRIQEAGW